MFMKKLSLREIQINTLEIIKELDKICKHLHINYFLAFGSLIGAVRHEGFIPWDDDLDIMMKRKDYDILINYFEINADNLKPLKLFSRKLVKGYPYNLVRVCDIRYKTIFDDIEDYGSGLFVDIYPLDAMGNNPEYWKKKQKTVNNYQKMLSLIYHKKWLIGKNRLTKICNIPLKIIALIRGANYYFDRLEENKNLYLWEDSEYIGLSTWGDLNCYKKELLDGIICKTFEGVSLPIPSNYNEILRMDYGDYMCLPPEEERKARHYYDAYRIDEEYFSGN